MKSVIKGFLGVSLVILVILILPLILHDGTSNLLCPIPASAQGNPCLEQEATISALQVVLLQSTLDAINSAATITALETTVAQLSADGQASANTSTSQQQTAAGLPFFETFENNNKGWDLRSEGNISATISNQSLLLSAYNRSFVRVAVPGIRAENFYLEADVAVRSIARDQCFGVWVGTERMASPSFHMVVICQRGFTSDGNSTVRLFEYVDNRLTQLSSTQYDQLWSPNSVFTLALEAQNGFYLLYLNDEPIEGFGFTPHGDYFGFSAYDMERLIRNPVSVSFDNVTVRSSR